MHSAELNLVDEAASDAEACGPTRGVEGSGVFRPSTIIVEHCIPAVSSRARHRAPARRLGKVELGPYADEVQMPSSLRRMLEKGANVTTVYQMGTDGRLLRKENVANEYKGIMQVLNQLCFQDDSIVKAYLCHPSVTHIAKMSGEGGFCGYRNIQMLISHIQDTRSQGYEHFQDRVPSILQLQDMIERAWDLGFCEFGRVETGGIKGTRKYIGTPEAQALFESLSIPCVAEIIQDSDDIAPHHRLLSLIEKYFHFGDPGISEKVCKTSLPPLYLQRPGHSLTVIGFERRRSGACNLLVFDPIFQPSPAIRRLLGTYFQASNAGELLKAYRRGQSHLQRFKTFEILRLLSGVSS